MFDKELFTKEERKALVEQFPYLLPRKLTTGEVSADYDFDYIRGEWEIPTGWMQLFLQACEDILEPLKAANALDIFRFSQIKEKYGQLRMYTFDAPKEVQLILDKYEFLSEQVCCTCGKPAVAMTRGWICPYCQEHLEKELKAEYITECDPINVTTGFYRTTWHGNDKVKTYIDCSDEWTRYLERVNEA